jgi:hypothetical protein
LVIDQSDDDAPLIIQVAKADCAPEGLTPPVTWVNGQLLNKGARDFGLTKIEPHWKAVYTYPSVMPTRPAGATSFFVYNAPVAMGISDGSFTLSFPNNGSEYDLLNNSECVGL